MHVNEISCHGGGHEGVAACLAWEELLLERVCMCVCMRVEKKVGAETGGRTAVGGLAACGRIAEKSRSRNEGLET